MIRNRKAIFLVVAALGCCMELSADGQTILQDRNGANLYIAGTPGDDVIFVWTSPDSGDLLVLVNGTLTNVTQKTEVTAATLYCVGTNLYGGNDTVSYQMLPELAGGTITNGGAGSNEVLKGKGRHNGSNIGRWVSPAVDDARPDEAEQPASVPQAPTDDTPQLPQTEPYYPTRPHGLASPL